MIIMKLIKMLKRIEKWETVLGSGYILGSIYSQDCEGLVLTKLKDHHSCVLKTVTMCSSKGTYTHSPFVR